MSDPISKLIVAARKLRDIVGDGDNGPAQFFIDAWDELNEALSPFQDYNPNKGDVTKFLLDQNLDLREQRAALARQIVQLEEKIFDLNELVDELNEEIHEMDCYD